MGSRSLAILPRLKPKPPPDPSGRHQNLAIALHPLRHRLHHPTAGRGEIRVTRCPLFRGKVNECYGTKFRRQSGRLRRPIRYARSTVIEPRYRAPQRLPCRILVIGLRTAPFSKMPLEADRGRSSRYQVAEVFQRSIAEQHAADNESGAVPEAS
jgi:hypothetical protein